MRVAVFITDTSTGTVIGRCESPTIGVDAGLHSEHAMDIYGVGESADTHQPRYQVVLVFEPEPPETAPRATESREPSTLALTPTGGDDAGPVAS